MLTDLQIQQLIRKFIEETLKDCEDGRASGYGLPSDEDDLDDTLDAYDFQLSDYRESLAFNKLKSVEKAVDGLLQQNSIVLDKESEKYKRLSREVLKATIEILQIEKERLGGNYQNPYDKQLTALPMLSALSAGKEKPSKSLTDVIDEYSREKISKKDWRPKTQAENASIYSLLLSVLRDIVRVNTDDIQELDRTALLKYTEVLSKLPPNLNKRKEFRDLSLQTTYEALLKKPVTPMGTRTYNKHIERVSAMFKWAVTRGYVERNPAESLTVKDERIASEEREAYDRSDLERLFSSPPYSSPNPKEPHKFFIPLLALYGGLRLEEACQLYHDDIKEIEGVFCIEVNAEHDKRVKTRASKRIVPIHPVLIELGLLQYWKKVKGVRLWEELPKGRDGYGHAFGKWYQKINRKYVTDNPKRVFHSFRHSFINNLKQLGVSETVIAELVGHSLDSITLSRYGKKYNVSMLEDAVKELDYGIDLSHVKFPSL